MKKQISYSIKKEEYPERTNKKTECNSLDPKFKNVVIKILKELKKLIDRNTVHCDKELETTKTNQSKPDSCPR